MAFAKKHGYDHGRVSPETGLCKYHTLKNSPLCQRKLELALDDLKAELGPHRLDFNIDNGNDKCGEDGAGSGPLARTNPP